MTKYLAVSVIALGLSFAVVGFANAYVEFERNETNQSDNDPSNDYGNASGTCNDGRGYTVNYQSDENGTTYYMGYENISGPNEDAVVRQYCGE